MIDRIDIKCAAENGIEAYLETLADAQDYLFSRLRREVPPSCRETLDALQEAVRAIDYNKNEHARYNAARNLLDEVDKLVEILTDGGY